MASIVSGSSDFAAGLCDALGLKHCRSLDISIVADQAVMVKAELYVTEEAAGALLEEVESKSYFLMEPEQEQTPSTIPSETFPEPK